MPQQKKWGFLKYYHPKVAAGKFDWDLQFFAALTKVQLVKNKRAEPCAFLIRTSI